jgi:hypothetical protein
VAHPDIQQLLGSFAHARTNVLRYRPATCAAWSSQPNTLWPAYAPRLYTAYRTRQHGHQGERVANMMATFGTGRLRRKLRKAADGHVQVCSVCGDEMRVDSSVSVLVSYGGEQLKSRDGAAW